MPKVKKPSQSLPPASSRRPLTVTERGALIDDMHKKIASAAALNGGFDTLLHKIDKIEQSQGQLVTKVDKIHEAIYDPNDGIFSKLAESKLENTQKFSDVEQKLCDISSWKNYKDIEDEKTGDVTEENVDKLAKMEQTVESLVASKEKSWAFIKWILVAVGGGAVSLLFSWLQGKLLH